MADDFEDHCWKDVVSADVLDIYSHYVRKTFVGPKPALLAIDLYDPAGALYKFWVGFETPVHVPNTGTALGVNGATDLLIPTKRIQSRYRNPFVTPALFTREPIRRQVSIGISKTGIALELHRGAGVRAQGHTKWPNPFASVELKILLQPAKAFQGRLESPDYSRSTHPLFGQN